MQFEEHFKLSTSVVTFENLGKDAVLVVPCPEGTEKKDASPYAHIASFVSRADLPQVQEFWKVVGKEMEKRVKSQGIKYTWLSTSGLGVH